MNVIWAPDAIRDLRFGLGFIGQRNATAARKLARKFQRAIDRVIAHPSSGILRDDLRRGLRCVVVRPYVLFFQIIHSDFHVLRILHGSQDTTDLFDSE